MVNPNYGPQWRVMGAVFLLPYLDLSWVNHMGPVKELWYHCIGVSMVSLGHNRGCALGKV